jgi:tetratricopeptide (TPR) repeat protein
MNIGLISKLTRSARITVAATVITVLVALPARLAWAATDLEQADVLIREGVRLRAQDQTARALPVFEEAYEISRNPRTAAQLGLCELELGSYLAAERHLAEALASPDHPWIARNRSTLKRQLDVATAKIGELALSVSPANAEILLNKKPVDRTLLGAPLRLDKGPVEVEVRSPGYEPAHETITIVGARREQRAFALVPVPAPPAAEAPATTLKSGLPGLGGAEPTPPSNPAVALQATSPSPTGAAQSLRTAAWITGGTALAALAFGTAEAFNAANKRDAFNDHTGVQGGVAYLDCGTADLSPACKPLKDAYANALTLSIVGFAAAGALAVTSSVLFVLSSPGHQGTREDAAVSGALACLPDIGIRGFGCALRF